VADRPRATAVVPYTEPEKDKSDQDMSSRQSGQGKPHDTYNTDP